MILWLSYLNNVISYTDKYLYIEPEPIIPSYT